MQQHRHIDTALSLAAISSDCCLYRHYVFLLVFAGHNDSPIQTWMGSLLHVLLTTIQLSVYGSPLAWSGGEGGLHWFACCFLCMGEGGGGGSSGFICILVAICLFILLYPQRNLSRTTCSTGLGISVICTQAESFLILFRLLGRRSV